MAAVWLRRLVLAAFIVLAYVPASAFAATMDYLGAWSSSTTYTTGKVVKHNGGIFYSLKSTNSAPNRNKMPSDNPTWWEPVGSSVKPKAVYDATGKYVGPIASRVYGADGWGGDYVGIAAGSLLVSIGATPNGFIVCSESAAACVPSVQNNFQGIKVYATTNCSGPAYYWNNVMDRNYARTYGSATSTYVGTPVAVSFDIYYPTNETQRTISSYLAGTDGCKNMTYGGVLPTSSASLYVNDGTFTKVSISGFTAPFYIK